MRQAGVVSQIGVGERMHQSSQARGLDEGNNALQCPFGKVNFQPAPPPAVRRQGPDRPPAHDRQCMGQQFGEQRQATDPQRERRGKRQQTALAVASDLRAQRGQSMGGTPSALSVPAASVPVSRMPFSV